MKGLFIVHIFFHLKPLKKVLNFECCMGQKQVSKTIGSEYGILIEK